LSGLIVRTGKTYTRVQRVDKVVACIRALVGVPLDLGTARVSLNQFRRNCSVPGHAYLICGVLFLLEY